MLPVFAMEVPSAWRQGSGVWSGLIRAPWKVPDYGFILRTLNIIIKPYDPLHVVLGFADKAVVCASFSFRFIFNSDLERSVGVGNPNRSLGYFA